MFKLLINQKPIVKIMALTILVVVFVLPLFVNSSTVMQILILIVFYAYLTSCWNFVGGLLEFCH